VAEPSNDDGCGCLGLIIVLVIIVIWCSKTNETVNDHERRIYFLEKSAAKQGK